MERKTRSFALGFARARGLPAPARIFAALAPAAIMLSCASVSQADLIRLDAAMARAEQSRELAADLRGEEHFPAEWATAQAHYDDGLASATNTRARVNSAVRSLTAAADGFDDIVERVMPLIAEDLARARAALAAAETRAQGARDGAERVQGQTRFPEDWDDADALFQSAQGVDARVFNSIALAITLFDAAVKGFDEITAKSAVLVAQELEAARLERQAALEAAQRSRGEALARRASTFFPNEWREAEAQLRDAQTAPVLSLPQALDAIAMLDAVAAVYADLYERSQPHIEREEAERVAAAQRTDATRALQTATTRADASRRAAMAADGQTHFPNDWRAAEDLNTAGRVRRDETAGILEAVTQLNSAADRYDNIAQRAAPIVARQTDEATRALQAATTRMQTSRAAAVAVDAQTFFPADWRNAETQNANAGRARRGTLEEMRAATALFTQAATSYDDLARRSGPLFASARTEATNALNAAVARASQARQAAQAAFAEDNFPTDWANLETRHRAAENANRQTAAEMQSASNLYAQVATAFDDLARRSAILSQQNEEAAYGARAVAQEERGLAIEARADVGARAHFDAADSRFTEAGGALNAGNFTGALRLYNQAATGFVASVGEAQRLRGVAGAGIDQAWQRREESIIFATEAGLTLEEGGGI
ncbi:MAG: hypothetical protein FWE09_06620 [Treponema sp.]|nr:hypothetical protein [Treponema sp.]